MFLVGSLIQTMILLNDDSYGFPSWQGTLLAFMAVFIAYIGVVYGARVLPYWQNAVVIVHVLASLVHAYSFLSGIYSARARLSGLHHPSMGECSNGNARASLDRV